MSTQELAHHISAVPNRLLDGVIAFARGYLRRRKFKRLHDLDDHLLDDIGVTRAEVEIATRLPFSHDAAEELRRRSLERRRHRDAVLRTRYHF